jgi:hypothetical protein
VFEDGSRLCEDWIKKFAMSNGFLIGIIIAVSIVNIALAYTLAAITKIERRHSITSELTSSTLKILIAQFINTVLPHLTLRLFSSSW